MKKYFIGFLFSFFVLISAVTFISCKKTVDATKLSLKQEEVHLFLGQSQQLEYTFAPNNTNNLKLRWTSSNKKQVSVNNYGRIKSVGGYGTFTITLTDLNSGLSDSCKVIVDDGDVFGISVDNETLERIYYQGQIFDTSLVKVYANYQSGVKKQIPVEECIFEMPDFIDLDTKIYINYQNYRQEIELFVIEDYVENIEIESPPTKTQYKIGESFDTSGMKVVLKYASGKIEIIDNYTFDDTPLKFNTSSIEIKYQDFTITQPITIIPTFVITNISLLQETIDNAKTGDGIMIKTGIFGINKTIKIPLSKNLTIYGESEDVKVSTNSNILFKLVNDITDEQNHTLILANLNLTCEGGSIIEFDKENSLNNISNFDLEIANCKFELNENMTALTISCNENFASQKHKNFNILLENCDFLAKNDENFDKIIKLEGILKGNLIFKETIIDDLNNKIELTNCEEMEVKNEANV